MAEEKLLRGRPGLNSLRRRNPRLTLFAAPRAAQYARATRFGYTMPDLHSLNHQTVSQYLKNHIRTVPDWPAPGVQFRDITPLLQNPKVFRVLIDAFVHRYMDPALRPDVVAGLDARGFILGAVVAYELNVGFVPIRKKGKLPFSTVQETYELEYGSATVELHTDAVKPGDRVLLIDDLIATGGTMMAGKKLLEKLGATVTEGAAIVDLPELGGSAKLREAGLPLFTLIDFAGSTEGGRGRLCYKNRSACG
jgi:adenine phosphoribosyltransferase